MRTVRLGDLFDVKYGNSFELINLTECNQADPNGVNFVSRTEKNNGISAHVERVPGIQPNLPNTITVAVSGSVLSTFVQSKPYYTGFHVVILTPRTAMSSEEMLFFAYAIRQNKYRYNYGRQANKTLKEILLPNEMPDAWARTVHGIPFLKENSVKSSLIELNTSSWKWFSYKDIFTILGGYYNKKPEISPKGEIPFIGATEYRNGVTSRHSLQSIVQTSKDGSENNHEIDKKVFKKGAITVSNNGSVGNAFYQPKEFTCSHDVNPLYLKSRELSVYTALFICTVIKLEKYRWNYGRKWRPIRMPNSRIKLPAKDDQPDWNYMEEYIKSLPYSANL